MIKLINKNSDNTINLKISYKDDTYYWRVSYPGNISIEEYINSIANSIYEDIDNKEEIWNTMEKYKLANISPLEGDEYEIMEYISKMEIVRSDLPLEFSEDDLIDEQIPLINRENY